MENLINKLFPPKCIFCDSVGKFFCENCLSNCQLIKGHVCIVCDSYSAEGFTHEKCKKNISPSQFLSVYQYEGLVRDCIKKSKYKTSQFMALKTLANEGVGVLFEQGLFINNFGVLGNLKDFTCLSIPLSNRKYKIRGFNQADVIAKIFANRFSLQFEDSILIRKKDTEAQHSINRVGRFKNIEGCFYAHEHKVRNRKFILIDDISTTGATFLEASKTLYMAGALEVKCFSLSKKV